MAIADREVNFRRCSDAGVSVVLLASSRSESTTHANRRPRYQKSPSGICIFFSSKMDFLVGFFFAVPEKCQPSAPGRSLEPPGRAAIHGQGPAGHALLRVVCILSGGAKIVFGGWVFFFRGQFFFFFLLVVPFLAPRSEAISDAFCKGGTLFCPLFWSGVSTLLERCLNIYLASAQHFFAAGSMSAEGFVRAGGPPSVGCRGVCHLAFTGASGGLGLPGPRGWHFPGTENRDFFSLFFFLLARLAFFCASWLFVCISFARFLLGRV